MNLHPLPADACVGIARGFHAVSSFEANRVSKVRLARRVCVVGVALLMTGTASAQFASHVVLSGLNNPRGMTFGADGGLYIAEAGQMETPGPDTPSLTTRATFYYGETGAITRWEPGSRTQVLSGLPTLYSPAIGEVTGVHDVGFDAAGNLYYTVGLGADPAMRTGPELNQFGHLMRLPAGGGAPESVADLAAYEGVNNPAGGPVDSNPFKLSVHAGGVLVADAGANAILNVGFDGTIDVVGTLLNLPPGAEAVPTSLALSDVGDVFVSQLTGFPFPVGGAGVFRVDDAGLSLVGDGFTNVIDLAYGPDGWLYVLEFAHNGLLSEDMTGGLWRLNPETGFKELLMTDGLIAPTALAFDADGVLYVANRGVLAGQGEVLRLQPVPEPAVTGALAAAGLIALVWWRRRARGVSASEKMAS
jgi:PEP-CTERM motif.